MLIVFLTLLCIILYRSYGARVSNGIISLRYLVNPPDNKVWGKLPREKNGLIKTGYVVELNKFQGIRQGLLSAMIENSAYEKEGELWLPLYVIKNNKKISFQLNLKGKVGISLVKKGLWSNNDIVLRPDNLEGLGSYLQRNRQIVVNILGSGGKIQSVCKYSSEECKILSDLQVRYATSNDKILSKGINHNDEIGYIGGIIIAVP